FVCHRDRLWWPAPIRAAFVDDRCGSCRRRDRSATLRRDHEKGLKTENREKIIREPQFMRTHRKSFIMLGFMAVALFTSATAQETNKNVTVSRKIPRKF